MQFSLHIILNLIDLMYSNCLNITLGYTKFDETNLKRCKF